MLASIYRHLKLTILPYFFRHPLSSGSISPPFFILSSGRSGSTLLRKILLRSGIIAIPPESNRFIPQLTQLYFRYNWRPKKDLISLLFKGITEKRLLHHWKIPITNDEKQLLINSSAGDSLAGIIHYFYSLYAQRHHPKARLWGDKTPLLLSHTDYLQAIYPTAKYIILVRDGRDVISSFMRNGLYNDIDYLCNRWKKSIMRCHQMHDELGAKRVMLISYEKLVKSSPLVLKEVCDFLSIPFDHSYLENSDVYMGDDHLPHFKQTKQGIHPYNIGKWESELTTEEKQRINELIGDTLKKLGYH